MLNRQQLQSNIEAMEQQGASQNEIQQWLNSLKTPQQAAPQNEPQSSRLKQFTTGVAKDVGKTIQGMSSFGEKMFQAPLKAVGMKFDDKTAAEQLVPKENFEAEGGWEKAGAFSSAIGQFLVPSGLITAASKALQATKAATKLAEGGKLANIARTALTRGVPEAGGLSGVSALRGESEEEVKTMAKWGVAVPTAFKGLSVMAPSISSLKSALTGVPGKVFERMKENPQAYEKALTMIEKTEKPFLGLSESIGQQITAIRTTARNMFNKAKESARAEYADQVFSLENNLPKLNKAISEFNLQVSKVKDKFVANPTTKTSPFLEGGRPNAELKQVQDIVDKIFKKDLSVDDLFDLQASLRSVKDKAYQAGDKKMISLIGRLTDETTKFIDSTLPQIKIANQMYQAYYRALENGGSKFVDAMGNLKVGGEQFLSNLHNANKGNIQKQIANLEKITGIHILDNVLLLKDAQKLNHLFPVTGSRTQDILRSFAVKGAGVVGAGSAFVGNVGGALAAGATVAATSPRLIAKETIALAKWMNSVKSKVEIPKEIRVILDRILGKDIKP